MPHTAPRVLLIHWHADEAAERAERLRRAGFEAVLPNPDLGGPALKVATAEPPADPVAPALLEGYLGTPLPKKLGIKAGSVVALLGAPEGFEETLGALPEGVRLRWQARGPADVVLLFSPSCRELARRFPAATRAMADKGRLWIVWPKKASSLATDLTQPTVRSFGLERGFVDYKICAVDATYSGLCFARREGS